MGREGEDGTRRSERGRREQGRKEGRFKGRVAATEADSEMNLAGVLPAFITSQVSDGAHSWSSYRADSIPALRSEGKPFQLFFLIQFFL